MIITMKQGAIALASLVGVSGGYTLKENFWHTQPQSCIASMVEEGDGNIRYRNTCAKPISTMICESYKTQRDLPWTEQVTKACFKTRFNAAATYSYPKANRELMDITIKECPINTTPRWVAIGYECTLDNI